MKINCDSVDLVPFFQELIGQKIVRVETNRMETILITNDGTRLTIETNEGCGGCSNGWSEIDIPNDLVDSENGIVAVDISDDNGSEVFTISIFKENGLVSKLSTDDGYGDGYYGGGFQVSVKYPK